MSEDMAILAFNTAVQAGSPKVVRLMLPIEKIERLDAIIAAVRPSSVLGGYVAIQPDDFQFLVQCIRDLAEQPA